MKTPDAPQDPGRRALVLVGEFGVYDLLTDDAHALSEDGDAAGAIARCHAIEALCAATGDEQTLRYALYIRGLAANDLGRSAEAVACAQQLLGLARRDLRPYWQVKALALEADARAARGDTSTAVDLLARASVMLGELDGRDYNQLSASGAIAIALRRLELFEASDAQLVRMIPRLSAKDGLTIVVDSMNTVAEWGLALGVVGQDSEAREKIALCAARAAWARQLVVETGRDAFEIFALTGATFARTLLGDTEQALTLLPALMRHPAMTRSRVERLLGWFALSVAHTAAGDFEAARADLQTLRDLAVSEDRGVWLAVTDAALMRLDVRQFGDHPAVERSYALYQRLAVNLWEERIARFDVLRTRMHVHELLVHGAEIAELTRTDDLTGVGNRRALEVALGQQGDTVASVFVDVDRFKDVNDRFSHVVGDRVLVRLAQILREQVRGGDTVVRFGGDEFLVVLDPSVGRSVHGTDAARSLARRLVAAVRAEDWSRLAPGLAVTVSVGAVARVSPAAMLAAVTSALHEAKTAGRDRVVLSGAVAAAG
jgi:diguanylate cyclase (GGDEF)-like protein